MHRNNEHFCAIHLFIVLVCHGKALFYVGFHVGRVIRVFSECLPLGHEHFKQRNGTCQRWVGFLRHDLLYFVGYLDTTAQLR
jgi:hypothetical protein